MSTAAHRVSSQVLGKMGQPLVHGDVDGGDGDMGGERVGKAAVRARDEEGVAGVSDTWSEVLEVGCGCVSRAPLLILCPGRGDVVICLARENACELA